MVAIALIVLAGFLNGSFALPTKHVHGWQFENIWLTYAFWSYFVLPWLFALVCHPTLWNVYTLSSPAVLSAMVIGGIGFGIGQLCFVRALKYIGVGLGFVINLGIGIGLGFLLPLAIQHPDELFTRFGAVTLTGSVLAIAGLGLSTYAGRLYEHQRQANPGDSRYFLRGCLMAAFAGLFSAGQNLTFALTAPMQTLALKLGASPLAASISVWPGFLFCTFLPFALSMLQLHHQQGSWERLIASPHRHYHWFGFVMGLFWYASLVLYSKAAQLIGPLGPVVGWPAFMVLIILTSNFWGWRYHEWRGSSRCVRAYLLTGIGVLLLAIAVLGMGAALR